MRSVPHSEACLICGESAPVVAHGVVAPFISELADLPVPTPVSLRACAGCDLDFFDGRFDDEQMSAIYGGYLSHRYFTVRKRWEPWYSRSVNDAYVADDAAVLDRLGFMSGILGSAMRAEDIKLVVDFGGDEGQFIPNWPNARKVVCDPSEKPLPEGVERIHKLADLGGEQPDLVIIAHVLEHLVDPLATLREIQNALADGGLLYAEVPLDRPRVRPWHATDRYRRMLARAGQHRPTFIPLDLAGGVSRQYGRRFPKLGAIKESEHINYFSPRSLTKMLEAAGFGVVSSQADTGASVGGLRLGRLGMLAKKAS